MKLLLTYILVAIVFISYFQSALEINNDYISNTFNDDCDVYIHSRDISSSVCNKVACQTEDALLPVFVFDVHAPAINLCFTELLYETAKLSAQKLFLKNRSLLI